jgi:tRNA A37 threonylcarbamoyladenosine synthetase subunit TsaC/SUA5/YrdC
MLADTVSVYLDAGEMSGPVPSTIIDMSGASPRVLRAGRLSVEDMNRAVPGLLAQPEEAQVEEASELQTDAEAAPEAPGDTPTSSPERDA